jgi:hypothetical protein
MVQAVVAVDEEGRKLYSRRRRRPGEVADLDEAIPGATKHDPLRTLARVGSLWRNRSPSFGLSRVAFVG